MGKRAPPKHASKAGSKRTTQYKAKGHLASEIQGRKKRKALQQKIDTRKMLKGRTGSKSKGKQKSQDIDTEEEDGVDALLQGDLMSDGEAEEAEAEEQMEADHSEAQSEDEPEDDDLASNLSDFGTLLAVW